MKTPRIVINLESLDVPAKLCELTAFVITPLINRPLGFRPSAARDYHHPELLMHECIQWPHPVFNLFPSFGHSEMQNCAFLQRLT